MAKPYGGVCKIDKKLLLWINKKRFLDFSYLSKSETSFLMPTNYAEIKAYLSPYLFAHHVNPFEKNHCYFKFFDFDENVIQVVYKSKSGCKFIFYFFTLFSCLGFKKPIFVKIVLTI
ncbi:hypothetical protein BpHYR1_051200 [Brachionus plicatilis]|uniref:Uncharacterized protein n=1 Tax=Brachionus plicatilis TaxID=10195 RepID=A0A3M7S4V5_BRAPC|nr:hypothetical protein BpHYR1_051200 [Brachionus plicatilis]